MSFASRLREARQQNRLTQAQLGAAIGVANSTIAGYERGTASPSDVNIVAMMQVLGVDANFLWQDDMKGDTENNSAVTPAAQRIAHAYDAAPLPIRNIVDTALEPYADIKPLRVVAPTDVEAAAELAPELPHLLQSYTAGTGNYLDDGSYTMTRFVNPPKRANIAVTVSGDSMLPKYSDGDIVFVETTSMLDDGEIGIFVVDGSSYIKQLRKNPLRLLSLNQSCPNVDVDENTTFYVVGRVLGKA